MRNDRSRRFRIFVVLAACAAVAALAVGAAVCLWLGGAFLPAWIEWNSTEKAIDLDGDGAFEQLSLRGRSLSIYDDGGLACSTHDEWLVSDAFATDVDADGAQDIVCITWKRGSFGEARPFWVEHDSIDFSQHIFIFEYREGEFVQKWLSSDIGIEAKSVQVDALGRIHVQTVGGDEHLLEWQSWGLFYVDDENPSQHEATTAALTLSAVGDVIPHTAILSQARKAVSEGTSGEGEEGGEGDVGAEGDADEAEGGEGASYDFSGLFANVAEVVQESDFAAVNVECPLVSDESLVSGEFPVFAAPTQLGEALSGAGFNVIEAANNHALDQGEVGLEQTAAFWEGVPEAVLVGISPDAVATDAQSASLEPVFVEQDGVRLALFDLTAMLNGSEADAQQDEAAWRVDVLGDASALEAALREAEGQADVSICFLHCGEEYATEPSDEVEALMSRLADAGADAIVCSHPHVVQRAERIETEQGNAAYVCYSLGNFAANQPYPETVLGAVATLTVHKSHADGSAYVAGCELTPTVCHVSDGQTTIYLLEDYSDELARSHDLNLLEDGSVTTDGLREQWLRSMG